MEELTVEFISKVNGQEMKAIITCRTREEFDELAQQISDVLIAWAEKYHPFPDLKRYQIGVEIAPFTVQPPKEASDGG